MSIDDWQFLAVSIILYIKYKMYPNLLVTVMRFSLGVVVSFIDESLIIYYLLEFKSRGIFKFRISIMIVDAYYVFKSPLYLKAIQIWLV
jgi:hypothetical protein